MRSSYHHFIVPLTLLSRPKLYLVGIRPLVGTCPVWAGASYAPLTWACEQMACWRCTRKGASASTAAPTTRRCGGATPPATTCATRAASTTRSTVSTARSWSRASGWWVSPDCHSNALCLRTGADADLLTRFYKEGTVQRWMSVEGMARGMKKVSRWRVD